MFSAFCKTHTLSKDLRKQEYKILLPIIKPKTVMYPTGQPFLSTHKIN
jgi:hypothetical protein